MNARSPSSTHYVGKISSIFGTRRRTWRVTTSMCHVSSATPMTRMCSSTGGIFPTLSRRIPFRLRTRTELCAVSVWRAQDFWASSKKKSQAAVIWKPLDKTWREVDPKEVRAGMVLLLKREMGGYLDAIGWTGDPADRPTPCPPPESEASEVGMEDDRDTKSARWVALEEHLRAVSNAAAEMPTALGEVDASIPWPAIVTAARWHDVGKAHPAFVNMLLKGRDDAEALRATLWAKSDDSRVGRPQYWVDGPRGREPRVGFRHELASAIAWLKHHGTDPNADLIAFLIAAHHGKVRASIRSLPNEDEAHRRGPSIRAGHLGRRRGAAGESRQWPSRSRHQA